MNRALRPALLALLVLGSAASAQEASSPADASAGAAMDLASLEARHAEVSAAIERAGEAGQSDALQRLERSLASLIEERRQSQELSDALAEAPRPLAAGPFDLADYEAALTELQDAEALLARAREAQVAGQPALEKAKQALEEAESQSATDPLAVETARTRLELRRAQLANARLAIEVGEQQVSRRSDRLEHVAARAEASTAEREALLDALHRERAELSRLRERKGQELEALRSQIQAMELRAGADAAARREIEARRAELASRQAEVALLGESLDRLERSRLASERLLEVFSTQTPSRDTLIDWRRESAAARDALQRELRLSRAEVLSVEQELSELPAERKEQRRALQQHLAAQAENQARLDRAIGGEERLGAALDQRIGSPDFGDQIQQLSRSAVQLWSFEITRSEEQPVTLGKVVIALATFFLGVLLAGWVTRWLGNHALRRVGVDEGAAHAYQSLLYYALLAIAFLVALRAVSIPLTAFAVVGGALAIGVGFGSQNIVNNFISGVILLAERPIKRGDLVQVGETYGNVERIGLRSTRVRTGENIHVIVPNAAFLENNVVNWTHTDSQVRLTLSVGVIYGSPTREVERLIYKAIEEHDSVLEKPAPVVLFVEFADNSLNFEARFWVRMRQMMERMKVESDLRYRIDDLFREANLVIAFPQRDVHLDAVSPIPVRILERGEDA